jgi:hypothetical protein
MIVIVIVIRWLRQEEVRGQVVVVDLRCWVKLI